jgi:hypothetical protein
MIRQVTSYHRADHLFGIAKRAASNSFKDADSSIISIMFSVTALEAFINESIALAELVPTPERQKVVEGYRAVMVELEERKEALLVKFHMGLLVFSGSTWDEGTQPFQDFKLLVTIRNHIVHMKAERWEAELTSRGAVPRSLDQYPRFIQTLRQRKIIGIPRSSPSWLQLINHKRVASWACETAAKITGGFVDAVPDGYYKESLKQHLFRAKRTV